jgi:hypothetical protein
MLRVGRLAVVAVWVGLLLVLARSHWPPAAVDRNAEPPATGVSADADDAWMGVYMNGQKVGYSHSRMTPTDGGYRLEETSFLRLSVMDQVQTVRAVIDATTTPDFAVRAFTVTLDSGIGAFNVRGTVAGQTLVLHLGSGPDAADQRIALTEPLYLPGSARARLRADGLAAGHTLTVRVFDPSAMEHQPMTMQVLAREPFTADGTGQQAWKVRETFRGMETSVWLDDTGRTLREEGPIGMVVQREDAARAVSAGWGNAAFDLMSAIAVRVRQPIADPRHLGRLTARMSGLGTVPVPLDGRQSFHDGVLRVEREPTRAATYALPYAGAEWRGELLATPFLQVDHPRIRDTAREILAGETEPRRAAERLRLWVYRELDKRPVASIPNALQVLEMRAGDCNEHAVLFAALARAAGLPARVVAGVVYADGAFLYHAWDEVWIGSGWLTVDAAFDQSPADATHVKLVEGGPETHAALVGVIGTLSIDVLPEPDREADS